MHFPVSRNFGTAERNVFKMKMNISLIIAVLLMIVMCLCLCACGGGKEPAEGEHAEIVIYTDAGESIYSLSLSYSVGGEVKGTTAVTSAEEGRPVGSGKYIFCVYADEVKSEKDLKKLAVTAEVTDMYGMTVQLAPLAGPSSFGDVHELVLTCEDGTYLLGYVRHELSGSDG